MKTDTQTARAALPAALAPLAGAQRVAAPGGRVRPAGKHLSLGNEVFRVKGATYGTFRPRRDGELFPEAARVRADFAAIAAAGLNTVRTYTLPPRDVLEAGEELGLRFIVGVHYADWREQPLAGRRARRRVRAAGRRAVAEAMDRCAGRSAVLAVSVGNEVPADLIRLHGAGAVSETLSTLAADVHAADPDMSATYSSFPTTEYLDVEGQDLVSFNVFLEDRRSFRRYLRHLQIVAGDLPLVVTELGLPAGVHGEDAQAAALGWQLEEVDLAGCAGATIFSWTDDWAVAGEPVGGWGFGLTDAERRPRPALEVVREWTDRSIGDLRERWPTMSVVVCAHNGVHLLEKCLASLAALDYPGLEVVVCDDGSTDGTASLARRFPFRLLELDHAGLAAARNAGIAASSGEIVAFIDADADCHPEWPYHLALSLEDENVVATGGPNLPVAGVGLVERAVALSPGGPIHVLTADDRAEHVPGCNMAFRRSALAEIGGFDPIYRTAGDDVDVCWKLLERDHEIGFAPAAQVHHRRRSTVRGYLRQQRGYGKAERLLSSRYAHRFNRLGQARWSGFIYGGVRVLPSLFRPLVYHGSLGLAPFQPVVRRRSETVLTSGGALLPVVVAFALLGALAPLSRWWLAAPALALGYAVAYALAVAAAARPDRRERRPLAFRLLVACLHVAQPLARTWGRLRGRAGPAPAVQPRWSGDRTAWLAQLGNDLGAGRRKVRWGQPHDRWDLEVSIGPFAACRITTAVAWGWNPLQRLAVRLRPLALAGLAVGGVLTGLGFWLGATLLALVSVGALLELVLLRRLVHRSVETTTSGARE